MDIAEAHTSAIRYMKNSPGYDVFNLGRGVPTSVLSLVKTFEDTNDCEINFQIKKKRKGDLPKTFTTCSKSNVLLKWQAKRNLKEMCRDAWKWQNQHPNGFNY